MIVALEAGVAATVSAKPTYKPDPNNTTQHFVSAIFTSPAQSENTQTFNDTPLNTTDSGFTKRLGPVKPFISREPLPLFYRNFNPTKSWVGEISEIIDDSVIAALSDSEDDEPSEIVELELSEFSLADLPLVKKGATFYWSIGIEKSPGGTERRFNEIRIRRMPIWSEFKLKMISKEVDELFEFFNANTSQP